MNSEFFAGNRARLRELFTGTAPIIISANGLLQRNADSNFPFRQDSSFWYFTGIDEPDAVLVMDKGKEYIIIPERDESRIAFDGAVPEEKLVTLSGVDAVYTSSEGWRLLGARIKKVKHVATLSASPAYVASQGLYINPARAALIDQIKSYNSDVELLDLRPHIIRMRMVKQSTEIEQIQRAIDATAQALSGLHKTRLSSYAYEFEVEAAITASFRKSNMKHAYEPIVAAGKNACTLHYIQNDGTVSSGDLLLLDVGAESNYYAADITRTYGVGEMSKRQRQVYDSVLEVQTFAYEQLTVGTTLKTYENKIVEFMGEKLRELGLIKSIDHETVRKYYPHATSHFLGLDVHDVADYDRPLEPGMVLTVEPGIYIPEESIGIRIEDDVLIGEAGLQILSADITSVLE